MTLWNFTFSFKAERQVASATAEPCDKWVKVNYCPAPLRDEAGRHLDRGARGRRIAR